MPDPNQKDIVARTREAVAEVMERNKREWSAREAEQQRKAAESVSDEAIPGADVGAKDAAEATGKKVPREEKVKRASEVSEPYAREQERRAREAQQRRVVESPVEHSSEEVSPRSPASSPGRRKSEPSADSKTSSRRGLRRGRSRREKRPWWQWAETWAAVIVIGGTLAASSDDVRGSRPVQWVVEQARQAPESDTETAVRRYIEYVAALPSWNQSGAFIEPAGRRLLLSDWRDLSPLKVHRHRREGEYVDLYELYSDAQLLADRPVLLQAYVTFAFPDPVPGSRDLVYQDVYLGVGGQKRRAIARCDITRPTDDRLSNDDLIEVRGVAVAKGIDDDGDAITHLACASARRLPTR